MEKITDRPDIPLMPRFPRSKSTKNVFGLIDTMIIIIIFLIVFLVFLLISTSCTGPGQLIDTGYIVSITENNQTNIHRFNSALQAEKMLNDSAGIYIEIDEFFGKKNPFFELKNSELFIYVEKKGIYEKNDKIRWRVYDK